MGRYKDDRSSSRYKPKFKAKLVLKALEASEADTEIASAFGIHPVTLSRWKNKFLREAYRVFEMSDQLRGLNQQVESLSATNKELERINQLLSEELDEHLDIEAKVEFVDKCKETLGLNRSCEVIGLPKSTYYYRVNAD